MIEARISRIKSRLARQLAIPGGCSVQEAVRRANVGVEARRVDATRELSAVVGRLAALCQERSAAGEATVYDLATALVDVAGLLNTGAFYKVAYGLCEVADRMTAQGRWDWSSVEVHVSALRLLLHNSLNDAAAATLLLSLAAVNDHYRP